MDLRLFIAIPLPKKVTQEITGIQKILNRAGVEYIWEPKEKLHITLAFLGSVNASASRSVQRLLSRIAAPPCTLRINCIRALPSVQRPHVLTLGIERNMQLEKMFFTINKRLAEEHLPTRPRGVFVPHVTIGRHPKTIHSLHIPHIPVDISFSSTSLALFQSTLHSTGSTYTLLASYPTTSALSS